MNEGALMANNGLLPQVYLICQISSIQMHEVVQESEYGDSAQAKPSKAWHGFVHRHL